MYEANKNFNNIENNGNKYSKNNEDENINQFSKQDKDNKKIE